MGSTSLIVRQQIIERGGLNKLGDKVPCLPPPLTPQHVSLSPDPQSHRVT